MHRLAFDPYVPAETMVTMGVAPALLDALLQRADYVSLHCPLTDETRHMIGERELRMLKRDTVLVNMSRSPVVDETALIKALREAWIRGAALDVLEREPPDPPIPRSPRWIT